MDCFWWGGRKEDRYLDIYSVYSIWYKINYISQLLFTATREKLLKLGFSFIQLRIFYPYHCVHVDSSENVFWIKKYPYHIFQLNKDLLRNLQVYAKVTLQKKRQWPEYLDSRNKVSVCFVNCLKEKALNPKFELRLNWMTQVRNLL